MQWLLQFLMYAQSPGLWLNAIVSISFIANPAFIETHHAKSCLGIPACGTEWNKLPEKQFFRAGRRSICGLWDFINIHF